MQRVSPKGSAFNKNVEDIGEIFMTNPSYSKLEESLVISEYESLREEIQARLSRVFKLQQGLLLGTMVYATTFYLPKLLNTSAVTGQTAKSLPIIALLYYSFLFILPFVAFVVELLCTSEKIFSIN